MNAVLVRSSSDSSYVSGSPGGSPSSGGEQQPSGLGARTRSSGIQDPGPLPETASGPPQESPRPHENQDDQPPPRLKKSFEIFVRKPTSSKPKPPPRKYFKSDPPKSLEEQEDSCPPGRTVSARAQVFINPSHILGGSSQPLSTHLCRCLLFSSVYYLRPSQPNKKGIVKKTQSPLWI
ncbi:pro-interleukin-16-like [Pteropus vampyrus]|uniref:Pro-interleukin-16-like n=1 Tax=Pteropus vampyrus TaxID=132908 RepID=A0A6P6BL64_PTEVA|nr:pro-interleukin-16-like [Pteropus vampyrus]